MPISSISASADLSSVSRKDLKPVRPISPVSPTPSRDSQSSQDSTSAPDFGQATIVDIGSSAPVSSGGATPPARSASAGAPPPPPPPPSTTGRSGQSEPARSDASPPSAAQQSGADRSAVQAASSQGLGGNTLDLTTAVGVDDARSRVASAQATSPAVQAKDVTPRAPTTQQTTSAASNSVIAETVARSVATSTPYTMTGRPDYGSSLPRGNSVDFSA